MDRQKLEKANKLIREIDKYEEVKDFINKKFNPTTQYDDIVNIENIRILKGNNGYLDFKIDRELSDKILLIIGIFLKENIEELNKEFEEL